MQKPKVRNPMLDAALAYLARGWSAFPLCPPDHRGCSEQHCNDCKRPGKVPICPWKAWMDTLPSEKQLHILWARNPHCNVGVAMGPVSNLIGLDIDGLAGEELLADISGGRKIETAEFRTGAGRRLLFKLPSHLVCPIKSIPARQGEGEALRLLGYGSQTVMPPSIHHNGTEYRWTGSDEVNDCDSWLEDYILDLTKPKEEADQEVVLTFPSPTQQAAPQIAQNTSRSEPRIIDRARAWLATMEPCDPSPEHPMDASTHLLKAATYVCVGFDLDVETGVSLLREWEQRSKSPFPERELRRKCTEALQHSNQPRGFLLKGDSDAMQRPRFNLNGNGHSPKPLPKKPKKEERLLSKKMSEITAKEVSWLWYGWLPLGKFVLLDGDPGLGKSTLLLDLAARVSQGAQMPGGEYVAQSHVLILSGEDDEEEDIKPRMMAAGVNEAKAECLFAIQTEGEEDSRPLTIPDDFKLIEKLVKETGAKLLIIDPLYAFLHDLKSDIEVRRAMMKIRNFAKQMNICIIGLRHMNKSNGTRALYRGSGLIAYSAAARCVMAVGLDPHSEQHCILAWVKGNNSARPQSWRFHLQPCDGGVCRVVWDGQCDVKADDLVAAPETEEQKEEKAERKAKIDRCVTLLEELLAPGAQPIKEVKTVAATVGFNGRLVERAAERLHLNSDFQMVNHRRVYYWFLPGTPGSSPPAVGDVGAETSD